MGWIREMVLGQIFYLDEALCPHLIISNPGGGGGGRSIVPEMESTNQEIFLLRRILLKEQTLCVSIQ